MAETEEKAEKSVKKAAEEAGKAEKSVKKAAEEAEKEGNRAIKESEKAGSSVKKAAEEAEKAAGPEKAPAAGKKARNKNGKKKAADQPDSGAFANYLAVIAIFPAVISVLAYEFLDYMLYLIRPWRNDYDPVTGLGIIIPMALMTELFVYFLARYLMKKVRKLTTAISQIARMEYKEKLDPEKMAPFKEVTTSLNQMAEDLESVEMLRTGFISDFSHEFKTPIVSIKGFADLLLADDSLEPEEQRQYLEIIAEESGRLSHMSQQTLLLSRLDTQTHLTDLRDYSLDEQIKQKIILLSRDWEAKEIDMDIDLPPVTYYGNPEIMSHIWINLLNNAIKFTPMHGTISVKMKEEDQRILVTIADNGPGMSEEACKRIFDRFYQADPSHATKGLGLGLSIVSRILELCGGSVSVESKEGEGSCFTVVLNR